MWPGKLNLRAWSIWWKLCPEAFVSLLLSSVVKAVTPYVTIFLSARIIDELSGARRPDQLLRWVVLTLACTAACALLQGVLTRWSNYAKGCAGQLDDQLYMDKMVALDYADVDRQAVFDLYAQIRQNENWAGWGIPKTISYFESFVTAVVQALGGVGLSVSLFLSPSPPAAAWPSSTTPSASPPWSACCCWPPWPLPCAPTGPTATGPTTPQQSA